MKNMALHFLIKKNVSKPQVCNKNSCKMKLSEAGGEKYLSGGLIIII